MRAPCNNMKTPSAHPVHVSTSLETRGGISAVLQVYRDAGFFDEWGAEHVASHTDQGGTSHKLMFGLKAVLQVLSLWLRGRISVLHVHTASGPSFWRKLLVAGPVLLSNTPVVLHVHGGAFKTFFYERCNPVQRWLVRAVLERSRLVLGLTEEWVQTLQAMAPRARVQALVNPVQMPGQPRGAADGERDVLLYLGLLDRKKGTHDLLEAYARLPERLRARWRLVLAGTGDIEGLQALAEARGVAHQVEMPGWIGADQKTELLGRAGALALPSYAEGLPMAVLEALAHGVPVVASAVGGIPQVVQNDVTGYLVAPGDLDGLTARLTQVLQDARHARQLGQRGRELVEAHYAAPAVLQALGRAYESLGLSRQGERRVAVVRRAAHTPAARVTSY